MGGIKSTSPPDNESDCRGWKTIALILLLAAAVRILGIWHSYPFSYYGDEIHFVERALSFGSFDFNPHWFHKPAFYMYVLFVEYGVFFIAGKLAGLWRSVTDFAVAYMTNPGPFYLIGRFTTTAFGLATVWMTYRLAREHIDRQTALFSALLLAVSFGHVAASQHVKADVPATFFTLASMYFLLCFVTSRRTRDLLMAAVVAGVGAATKVYSLILLGPIWLAVSLVAMSASGLWWRRTGRALAQIVGATVVLWGSYFICSPFSFLDPLGRESTFRWASRVSRNLDEITAPMSLVSSIGWVVRSSIDYARTILSVPGMGPVVGFLGLGGLVFLLFKPDKRMLVFLSAPIAFAVGSLYLDTGAEVRHQLPLYPFLALGGGALIASAAKRLPKALGVGLLALALAQPVFSIVERGVFISRTDTRNLAKTWIEENIAAGTKLLLAEEGPILATSPQRLREQVARATQAGETGQFTAHYDLYLEYRILAAEKMITYDIFEIRWPWWRESLERGGEQYLTTDFDRDYGNPLKPVGVDTYQSYVDRGFEYAVVQSERYESWFSSNAPVARYPGYADFYRDLFERGHLVQEFDPRADNRPGPTVKVFALR